MPVSVAIIAEESLFYITGKIGPAGGLSQYETLPVAGEQVLKYCPIARIALLHNDYLLTMQVNALGFTDVFLMEYLRL